MSPRPVPACGTRPAYQRHLRLGEPVDQACRNANTQADRRLRETGTTKVNTDRAEERAKPARTARNADAAAARTILALVDGTPWHQLGACRDTDPDEMFPPEKNRPAVRTAKARCFTCPVRVLCAEAAMEEEKGDARDKRHGVRGGLTSGERFRLDPTARTRTKPQNSGRPPSPCGTAAAYERHLRRGEPVDDACRAANTARAAAARRAAS